MNVLETLIAGREIIRYPQFWTQGNRAKTSDGSFCFHWENGAVKWSSDGVLYKLTENPFVRRKCEDILNETVKNFLGNIGETVGLVRFNDSWSHKEVLSIWDAAISIEKSKLPTKN